MLSYIKLPPPKINDLKNTPIIILHGFLGMGRNWMNFAKRMLERMPSHPIYLLDLRNHGNSFHTNKMNYDIMANDVLDFLDYTKIKKIKLAGHSMGGKVALTLAKNNNILIEKLIIIEMGISEKDISKLIKLVNFLNNLNLENFSNRKKIENHINNHFNNPLLASYIGKNFKYGDISSESNLLWKCNMSSIAQNINFLKAGIKFNTKNHIPSLFLKGNESNYLSKKEIEYILNIFTNAKIKSIRGGHWLLHDNPNEMLNMMIEFLKKLKN